MGRSPCCERKDLKKGPWSPEEDQLLIDYISKNGHGSWRALPKLAGKKLTYVPFPLLPLRASFASKQKNFQTTLWRCCSENHISASKNQMLIVLFMYICVLCMKNYFGS